MMKSRPILSFTFLLILLFSCNSKQQSKQAITLFANYYEALSQKSESKWLYTQDTVKQWFDEKKGDPILIIKNKKSSGKWKEWDLEMNASTYYDSIWFDKREKAVKGYFYENNDFYDLIGKGPTKTLRTFWFNDQNKLHEILIYWIPEVNTTTSQHLEPIHEWALIHHPDEIEAIYPNGRIVPSVENAKRWKVLLNEYNRLNDDR